MQQQAQTMRQPNHETLIASDINDIQRLEAKIAFNAVNRAIDNQAGLSPRELKNIREVIERHIRNITKQPQGHVRYKRG